ncbi:hypothetical protein HY493_01605 [Candidatus Woesearchaeota archaeon]|nr:hypothetical protein [Candidatus Woesearchaeota archaeon]
MKNNPHYPPFETVEFHVLRPYTTQKDLTLAKDGLDLAYGFLEFYEAGGSLRKEFDMLMQENPICIAATLATLKFLGLEQVIDSFKKRTRRVKR